jgi:hypothetical protein
VVATLVAVILCNHQFNLGEEEIVRANEPLHPGPNALDGGFDLRLSEVEGPFLMYNTL